MLVAQQKPPTMRLSGSINGQHSLSSLVTIIESFILVRSIVYFFHSSDKVIGPIEATPESRYSPAIPPTWNLLMTSPPYFLRAQNVSFAAPVKSYASGILPQ